MRTLGQNYFAVLMIVNALVMSASRAAALVIEPVELSDIETPEYSLFWLHNSENERDRTPRIGVIPHSLELVKDSVTGRPRLGIQYAFPTNGQPSVLLTLTARTVFDNVKVKNLAERAVRSSSSYSGQVPTIAILQPSSTRYSFYYRDNNTGIINYLSIASQPSVPSVDGTVAFTIDMSSVPRAQLARWFSAGDMQFGISAVRTVKSPVVVFKAGRSQSTSLQSIINGQRFISSDRLAQVLASANSPPGFFDWLFGRANNTLDVRSVLAEPRMELVDGALRFGWLTTRPDIQARLAQFGNSSQTQAYRFQEELAVGGVLVLDKLCQTFPNNFVDLDASKSGCGGLE